MKIILKRSQLGNIFSKLSRSSYKPSLLHKIRTWIGDDQTIALVILNEINEGNVSNVVSKLSSFWTSERIEFNVGNIPVIIYEYYDYSSTLDVEYSIEIPVMGMERTDISSRIGGKIWNKLKEYDK